MANEVGCMQRFLRKINSASRELQLSSCPQTVVGRDSERLQIQCALEKSIRALGYTNESGAVIYISGLPGVGKTAVVRSVLRTLEDMRIPVGQLPLFECIEFNGMNSPKPDVAYNLIARKLNLIEATDKVSTARLCTMLSAAFQRPDERRPILVVVLDEMDFMVSNKQRVLYNLVEWSTWASSKLVLVGIANTMDLPERLPSKIQSRLAGNRIVFPAYNAEQIQRIVEQRLQELDVFAPEAIQIFARSLAHKSGDIRKALTVCRRALDVYVQRITCTRNVSAADCVVTPNDLERAEQMLTSSAADNRLRECSKFECFFLVALQMELKCCEGGNAAFENVVDRFAILCQTRAVSPIPRLDGIVWMSEELERSGIVRLVPSNSSRFPRIELCCSVEEIHTAFLSHPVGMTLIT